MSRLFLYTGVFVATVLTATFASVSFGLSNPNGAAGSGSRSEALTAAGIAPVPDAGAPTRAVTPSTAPAAARAAQKAAVKAEPAAKQPADMTDMPGMAMPPASVTDPVRAATSLAGVRPSAANPPNRQYHEFQVNCTITAHRSDDPIVYPGRPGVSHNHTFFGNTTTRASSTLGSLLRGRSSCKAKADLTAYWMPTLYNGSQVIDPTETITYYKADVIDYTSVRPFPKGLRFVAGSPKATEREFAAHGYWSCVSGKDETHIPATCPAGNKLIARLVAPSCWDGVHLDVPDHHSHMAYPVKGRCTSSHPVALPMLQFKIPYPVSGNMSKVHLASGKGFTFHYDFFNAWDPATQAALVKACINGGLQCDAMGYDQHHPQFDPVLTRSYALAK